MGEIRFGAFTNCLIRVSAFLVKLNVGSLGVTKELHLTGRFPPDTLFDVPY